MGVRPPPLTEGFSENFASLNRGKGSVALNLKDPAHLALARELVLAADVLLENNRPGVMDRLGLGWAWFQERKPSLVYCSISAYGQTGPRAHEGGFDVTIQAASGIMSVTGEAGGAPVKCGVPVSDFTAGLYAAFSIAAKLAQVRQSGIGGHIDVPMFSTSLAIAALQTSEYFGTGHNPRKLGSAHPRNAPYQAFEAADGWFVIAAGNNRLWASVCEVLNVPEWLDDPRFTTPGLRAQHQAELVALMQPLFIQHPVAHWLAAFAAVGVPNSPINPYASALQDPQAQHLQLVQPIRLPNGVVTQTVVCPVRLDGETVPLRQELPTLGERNALLHVAMPGSGA